MKTNSYLNSGENVNKDTVEYVAKEGQKPKPRQRKRAGISLLCRAVKKTNEPKEKQKETPYICLV